MIYLDNNTFQQEIYIPRSSARNDASPEYATKTELENAIENEVIRADGKYATKTDLLPYATTGWVESQDYATKEWTEEQIASETARTEETYQKISEMSAYSTTIEVESMIDDAVSGKADSSAVTAQISEVKAEIEAEIPTRVSQLQNDLNFIDKTVNNLVNYYTKSETYTIEQVNALVAAIPHFQIVVVNRLPSVGDASTVYLVRKQDPSTSDLYDEYIWVNNTWEFLGSATVDLSQYWTSAQTQSAITFALRDYRTESQIRNMISQSLSAYSTTQQVQTLINNAVRGKADTSAVTASIAAATAATTGWVESQGYLTAYTETDPVFMASAASGISVQDISNWDNKLDASALTPYYTSAQTDTAISNAVSGKADSSAVTEQISDAKEEIEAEIPTKLSDLQNDLNFVNSGDVKTQIEGYNYINSGQAQTQIDSSISSAIAAETARTESTYLKEHQSLANYYTKSEINQGFAQIENHIAEKADSSAVTQEIADALVGYATIEDIPTVPTNLSELYNDVGFVDSTEVDTKIQTAMEGVATTGDVETMLQDYATQDYVDNSIGEVVQGLAYIGVVNDITTSGNTVTVKKTGLNEGQIVTSTTSFDVALPQDITNAIAAETARTESTYLKEHQDITGKLDTSAFTAYTATTQTELNNKQDASAMTAYATTAFTENTYAKTGDIPTKLSDLTNDEGFVNSGEVETQITSKGYITGYTETDPVFMSSPASGITSQDITNWDAKLDSSALTPYYTSAQTVTAISNAVSGKVDTSAMTEYYTSAETETAIQNATNGLATEQYVDDAIAAIDIPTVPTNVSEFVNDAGYITSDYVDNAVSGKAEASALTETNNHIDNMEEMTATALLDLKTNKADATALTEYAKSEHLGEVEQVTSVALNNLETNKVGSTDVHNMVVVTQAQYNALTPDPNTFYIIVG
jgi:hypothetical protein